MSNSLNFFDDVFFCGEYRHSLDSQQRLAIPKEWRKHEDLHFVLFPGRDSLMLMPIDSFKDFLQKARKVSIADRTAQLALAQIGAKVQQCRCDKQGRIKINKNLLDSLNINDQAVLIGSFSNIQIWNPAVWDDLNTCDSESTLDEVQKISERPDALMDNFQALMDKIN